MHRACLHAALILVSLFAFACKGAGISNPVIASLDVRQSLADPSSTVAFARSNVTDYAIVGARVEAMAGLYVQGGIPIVVPYTVQAGNVVAINRKTKEKVEVKWGEPLPAWAALAFPGGRSEGEAIGLVFLQQ